MPLPDADRRRRTVATPDVLYSFRGCPAPISSTSAFAGPRDAPPDRLSPNYPEPAASLSDDSLNIAEQPKLMSAALFQAAKQFDILVAALPLSEGGEEAQLRRIAELEAENEAVGEELQKQLEAAERELRQIQELFSQASDNCLNLKRLD
uniref:Mediator of RNA polymerase II transcription subunit 21 n=1 Tax=Anthurium amnicola TaxID=1678845 RepID=A0A1D1YTM8_9ARAE